MCASGAPDCRQRKFAVEQFFFYKNDFYIKMVIGIRMSSELYSMKVKKIGTQCLMSAYAQTYTMCSMNFCSQNTLYTIVES